MEQQQRKKKVVEDVSNNNEMQGLLIAAAVVIFSLIVLFILYKRTKKSKRIVLITGLCDSGKTLLFSRLLHNKSINTQTSIKENTGDYFVNGKSLKLIDIPGHERLRDKFFDQYKSLSRGIIYVIDSQTFSSEIRDIAEFLYNILTDPSVSGSKLNLVVLCNKQDLPKVKGCILIKSQLEKELNTLRVTKSSQLDSVDPKAKKQVLLGDENAPFNFDALDNLYVEFLESNNYGKDNTDDCNVNDLKKWLLKIA